MTDNPTLPLVEAMARAIREEQVRQFRDNDRAKCPDATFYEEHVGPYGLAQAAAAIAQRRVSELEAALEKCMTIACLYTVSERVARSDIANTARAALTNKGANP